MKSIDLWNNLISNGEIVIDNRITPKTIVKVKYRGKTATVDHLDMDDKGDVTITYHTNKYSARFNQGVVTINLPDVALSAKGDLKAFWKIFDERLELCHRALRLRHERLLGRVSDMAPILWQHGALARLKSGEKIDRLLYDGYSTLSLGYGGLYECVKALIGESHTTPAGEKLGLEIMQHLNDACNKWKNGWKEQRIESTKLNEDIQFDLEED